MYQADSSGLAPLLMSSQEGDQAVAKLLLAKNAKVDQANSCGALLPSSLAASKDMSRWLSSMFARKRRSTRANVINSRGVR